MGIDVERNGRVATVRINRPDKLNALSLQMYTDLGKAFVELRDDDSIRAVILTGAGDRAFSVGADLKESIPALARDEVDISAWDPAHLKGARFYKPIVCAIRGMCIGGGFELMLGTDIRVAAEDSIFQLPEVKHGFVPAGGTLVRLVRQIAYAHAMELLLSAKRFSADQMLSMGVVNCVVASSDVEVRAFEIAAGMAEFSPNATQTIKEAVLTLQDLSFEEAFAREAMLGQRTFTSDEARKALLDFANRAKRAKDGGG